MSDWKERSLKHLAKRDAAVPKEYLVDLASLGIEPCPFTKEALPRPLDPKLPFKPDKDVSASIYPTDSVVDVPRKVLDMQDVAITETPLEQLVEHLATKKLTSLRCTEAFLRRALLAHQLVNCCTETFVDYTISRAKECDEYLEKQGKPIGPLHGLPVSLKDQFHIAKLTTSMGYVKDVDFIAEEDSVITTVLLRAGAVPLIRTNIPQSLMRCETDNYIFGRTVNPYNRAFTPGGSSGGEGALVGMHGSPLGLGTDIGGSVRVPSAFNGLWGMRPSMHRIPYEGSANSFLGQHTVYSVIGPMTHSHGGLVAFMRAVLGQRPWELDPILVPMAFNEEAFALKDLGRKSGSTHDDEKQALQPGKKGQLCFAIEWDDGIVHPHPPITRALREVREKLIAAGHKVVDWVPLDHARAYDIIDRIYAADGGEDIRRSCAESGEPVMYNLMAERYQGADRPNVSVFDCWQVAKERDAYRKAYLDHWNATAASTGTGRPVDAVLAPVSNCAACPHDTNDYVVRVSSGQTRIHDAVELDRSARRRHAHHPCGCGQGQGSQARRAFLRGQGRGVLDPIRREQMARLARQPGSRGQEAAGRRGEIDPFTPPALLTPFSMLTNALHLQSPAAGLGQSHRRRWRNPL
ncbi:amidase signature enzyme [Acaromyces ingoldii]|uniref:amidase n=1 Tax=Acaromyces ingoldii TaxID=215250 RepID=A0A316YFT0_9BASI|nr:amidase signature enzyme [Acaromyces ingoldii]PWN88069.1 amidase signature enzyme [Acaromyces ingoldii]